MLIGSMFTGCGGLDMAVQTVFPDAEVAWHAEYDAAASRVLSYRWPGVPNLGDVTKVDWAAVEPVTMMTGGSPCQDLSTAGGRAGMTSGTRSNLWVAMREAISIIRPRLVLWENVRGSYSAKADSSVGLCDGCVGHGSGEPVLRALGRVLGDLASLGYDSVWHGLRAADVGAPHNRFRVFVLAWDAAADAGVLGQPARGAGGRSPEITAAPGNQLAVADPERFGRNTGWGAGPGEKAGGRSLAVEAQRMILLPTPSAADGAGGHLNRSGERSGELLLPGVARAMGLLPTPLASDGTKGGPNQRGGSGDLRLASAIQPERWAEYADAIHQWETLTRPAPDPTVLGRTGKPQLAPAFSEWMMGYPAGHVTEVPGVTRPQQLTILGNGVVSQQGVEAFRRLLILVGMAKRVAS